MAEEEAPPEDSRWEGEDLAGKITFGDELYALAHGEAVDPDRARELVMDLLDPQKRVSGSTMSPETEGIAFLIVESLPDELMYQGAIEALDVRPFLDAIAAQPDKELRIRRTMSPDQEFVPDANLIASLRAEQDTLAEEAARELIAGDTTLTQAERDAAVADLQEYDPKKIGKKPLLVGQDRTATRLQAQSSGYSTQGESSALSDEWSPMTLQEQATQRNGFPQAEFQELLANDMIGLTELFTRELQWQQDNNSSESFKITMGQTGGPSSSGTGESYMKTMNVMEAIGFLRTRSESEVADLQAKMAAAGYYNELQQPRGYVPGDAYDPATKEAWGLLLTEAAQRGMSPTKLVGERLQGYQERQRAMLEQQMLPIDEEYLRSAGDMAMRELLGRQMTVAESKQLTAYLDALRSERAGFLQGGGALNEGIDGPLRGDYGFDETDVSQKIMEMGQVEAGGRQGFDSVQSVWQAFDLEMPKPEEIRAWRAANRPAWMTEEEI